MIKKSIKAQLIEALDKNDSKAVREACIKLNAVRHDNISPRVQDFLNNYYLDINAKGQIVSTDYNPYFDDDINLYKYLKHYLKTKDYQKIDDFKKEIDEARKIIRKDVSEAEANGNFNFFYKKPDTRGE